MRDCSIQTLNFLSLRKTGFFFEYHEKDLLISGFTNHVKKKQPLRSFQRRGFLKISFITEFPFSVNPGCSSATY